MTRKLQQGLLLLMAAACISCFFSCKSKKQPTTDPAHPTVAPAPTSPLLAPADSAANAYGIDISKFQGDIVNDIINRDGLSFVICKATEGETYTDPDFIANWAAVKQKGLVRGAYHFYHTADMPDTQARFFVKTLQEQGLDSTDLPPILDIETLSLGGQVSVAAVQQGALTFLKLVEQLSKRTPMVYSSLSFANTYLSDPQFARYPLWIAEYTGGGALIIPKTWNSYVIWQRSSTYTIDSDTTDYDAFNGSRGALYRFIQESNE